MERIFVYAVCWSIGALLELEGRQKFHAKISTMSPAIEGAEQGDTFFEYFVNEQVGFGVFLCSRRRFVVE
jgi:dynein heavy chain